MLEKLDMQIYGIPLNLALEHVINFSALRHFPLSVKYFSDFYMGWWGRDLSRYTSRMRPGSMAGLRYPGFIVVMLKKVVEDSLKKVDNRF